MLCVPKCWGYFEHQSECGPKHVGEGKTRPAGWEKRSASKGTRVNDDDDKGNRGKYLIKWKADTEKKRDRELVPFPEE